MTGLRDTWLMFKREHQCSIDRMLCSPALRAKFLDDAKLAIGSDDEESILWELVSLRKRKELPKSHPNDANTD